MAKHRLGRINEEIKKEISNIVRDEINDPRLTAMVSITKVEVTNDLRYAKVFVSLFGKGESQKESFEALKSSTGYLRREIGHRINLRYTPEIILELDNSIEQGIHISHLLNDMKDKSKNED